MSGSLSNYIVLSGLLFAIGFFGVLLRKNTLVIFMSLELMLIASTLALVAFSRFNGTMDGNVLVVNWGSATPVVYALGADGSLKGLWAAGDGARVKVTSII